MPGFSEGGIQCRVGTVVSHLQMPKLPVPPFKFNHALPGHVYAGSLLESILHLESKHIAVCNSVLRPMAQD